MRAVDPVDVPATSACAVVARSSAVAPEFLLAENRGGDLMAARWRRRRARLGEPEFLSDHLISYCAAGTATGMVVADGTRTANVQRPGVLTFLHADQRVQWAMDAIDEVVHVHLYVSARALASYARTHGVAVPEPMRNFIAFRDPWLEGYFRLLISEYDLYGANGRLADSLFLDETENLLHGRLLFAQLTSGCVPGGAPPARPRISPLRPTIVRRIADFVAQNLASDIRLEQLAALAAVSVDHFVRAFRQATGLTPHRFVLERRLETARELLRDDPAPISAIARRCGFASAAHFSAVFHGRFGVTPSQYRARH
jgi:AraC family transcriptional regulator